MPGAAECRCARLEAELRRRLSKLSCAGWLPHDRGFVLGLPRSREQASAWPAHNRERGFPTAFRPRPYALVGRKSVSFLTRLRDIRALNRCEGSGDGPDESDHFPGDRSGHHDFRFPCHDQAAIAQTFMLGAVDDCTQPFLQVTRSFAARYQWCVRFRNLAGLRSHVQ